MSIKKEILIISVALLFTSAAGQTFIKPFIVDSLSTAAYRLVVKDSFYFIAGNIPDPVRLSGSAGFLAKFDNNGDLMSDIIFRNDAFINTFLVDGYGNALINTGDGGIAAAGEVLDTSSQYLALFSKFDSSGNLLFYKTYDFGLSDYQVLQSFGLVEFDSNYFIVGEVQLANYYCETTLAKLDLQGNLIFAKTYSDLPELYGTTESVCVLPDSNLLISVGRDDNNNYYWESVLKTCFLEVDTGGNLINQYCTPDSDVFAFCTVAAAKDGHYLSSGSYEADRTYGSDWQFKQYLVKWDTAFNIIWQLKVGEESNSNFFFNFKQDADSNIILCGQLVNDTNWCGVLAKVDKNGHLLWYRRYEVPTGLNPDYSENYLIDMSLLPNGDIVAVGTWGNTSQSSPFYFEEVGWILRVDSNGCLNDSSCGIATGIEEVPTIVKPEPVIVYPNPSDGVFSVHVFSNLPDFTNIEVYDVMGRKLLTQPLWHQTNLLNLQFLPSGMYFYRAENEGLEIGEGKLVIEK